MNDNRISRQVVEVRPEVVFIYELLEELTSGRIKIPRFQRPFVWRREQMIDLLDSVYNQYPIGSLLVWETEEEIATLDNLGPFSFPDAGKKGVGYLLDGHQRLTTLAGALVLRGTHLPGSEDRDPGKWDLVWNMETEKFQHGSYTDAPHILFPLPALLDTLSFFEAADRVRRSVSDGDLSERYVLQLSRVARSFQHYRVPVIRIKQTGLSEAVEIFARLNSKGQSMTADQMVSALMYSSSKEDHVIDLADEIDEITETLGARGFGDTDRTAILRAILANLGEDIYSTDWTRLASSRRKELGRKLESGVESAKRSLHLALDFLDSMGVKALRLLPYSMQLVVLSSAFDSYPKPSMEHLELLRKWFWVSSFSGWFGAASTSRINSLVSEVRRLQLSSDLHNLQTFDLNSVALPYPPSFDMRSARTKSLLLVCLDRKPRHPSGEFVVEPWQWIASQGPGGVGFINDDLPQQYAGNPANRLVRVPGAPKGVMWRWVVEEIGDSSDEVLSSHCLDRDCVELLRDRQVGAFVEARQRLLMAAEEEFLYSRGIIVGDTGRSANL